MVLTGLATDAGMIDRSGTAGPTFAGTPTSPLIGGGSSQQVMLEVRFVPKSAEISAKHVRGFASNASFRGVTGLPSLRATCVPMRHRACSQLGSITNGFALLGRQFQGVGLISKPISMRWKPRVSNSG
jgi:hypothetical protein